MKEGKQLTAQHRGEERVEHALPRQQRRVGEQLLRHGARRAHLGVQTGMYELATQLAGSSASAFASVLAKQQGWLSADLKAAAAGGGPVAGAALQPEQDRAHAASCCQLTGAKLLQTRLNPRTGHSCFIEYLRFCPWNSISMTSSFTV